MSACTASTPIYPETNYQAICDDWAKVGLWAVKGKEIGVTEKVAVSRYNTANGGSIELGGVLAYRTHSAIGIVYGVDKDRLIEVAGWAAYENEVASIVYGICARKMGRSGYKVTSEPTPYKREPWSKTPPIGPY